MVHSMENYRRSPVPFWIPVVGFGLMTDFQKGVVGIGILDTADHGLHPDGI